MKNNRGFTLIELIAVVVMMGMILLVVFPATSRLLRSNENEKYDSYYDSVQEAIELYARTRRDELGGIKGDGCIDDKKLSELKSFDYINEFKDEKNVTCLSPGDFTISRLATLGIDTSKQYVNVRIDNKKGKVSVKYSMICVRNIDDPSITSLVYSNLIEKETTCENYVPVITNSLYNEIKEKYSTTTVGTHEYVQNNPNNNYVWYSGNLWRIIGFNTDNKTIKLVTDDSVAILNYNNKETSSAVINDFSTSNIYYWLINKFLPTLRNPEKYLYDAEWNYSYNDSTTPPSGGNTTISKVGLINSYEYKKAFNYLKGNNSFWLITQGQPLNQSVNSLVYTSTTNDNLSSTLVSEYHGVRPSIVLKPNITYVNGGNGTINNPYKLVGDISANVGSTLNSRYPGEYVTYNNTLFRISLVNPGYTKLIAVNTIPIVTANASTIQHIQSSEYNSIAGTIGFHNYDTTYSDNTYIGSYLRLWTSIDDELLTDGDFCRMDVIGTTSHSTECPQESIFNSKIAIPKVGDLYAINYDKQYWTLSGAQNGKINVINTNCTIARKSIDELAAILPVVVINSPTTITGGNGTSSNPYTIE